jgi:hypothetical protein
MKENADRSLHWLDIILSLDEVIFHRKLIFRRFFYVPKLVSLAKMLNNSKNLLWNRMILLLNWILYRKISSLFIYYIIINHHFCENAYQSQTEIFWRTLIMCKTYVKIIFKSQLSSYNNDESYLYKRSFSCRISKNVFYVRKIFFSRSVRVSSPGETMEHRALENYVQRIFSSALMEANLSK